MRIGIDARLYGVASGTGIGRYVEEVIRAVAALHDRGRAGDADGRSPAARRSPSSTVGVRSDRTRAPADCWEFVVFLRRDGYDAFTPPNDRWAKVLADFRPYTIGVQTKYPRTIRDAGVDLMHFPHFDHPIRCPVPFVTTIHDLILLHHPSIRASTRGPLRFWTKYLAYRTVLRHAIRKSRSILTPSETIRRQLHAELGVPLDRITATPLGVDHVAAFPISNSQFPIPRSPYVLYIGNAYPHKQITELIAAVSSWRTTPELQRLALVLVGRDDDFTRPRQRETARLPWVLWYGSVSEPDRTLLVRNAVAYVTASGDEGFDLPTVEALALGTPIIASDIPVHHEILGDAAITAPVSDWRSLAGTIRDLLINTGPASHRATLIARGRARAARYRWRTCANATTTAYAAAFP